MNSVKQLLTSLLLLCLVSTALTAQELDTTLLNRFFQSLEKRNEAMGSVAILKNGKLLYEKAIGYQNLTPPAGIPATTKSIYQAWSIGKTFISTMILQMVEEGKLRLETTLDQYFPQVPNASNITIRQMLSHRSGIHDYTQNPSPEPWETELEGPIDHHGMIRLVSQLEPDFAPGERFQYSNSNYLLLGYMIERLDSLPFTEALARRITIPLGLKDTFFGSGTTEQKSRKCYAYARKDQWVRVDEGEDAFNPSQVGPGILTTPAELTQFIEALFEGRLLSPQSLEEMIDIDDFYGLGIIKSPFSGHDGFGHSGGYLASRSNLVYFPREKLAVAYCTNGHVYQMEEIVQHVLQVCFERPFGVSVDRWPFFFLLLGLFIVFFTYRLVDRRSISYQRMLILGVIVPILFWAALWIAGRLHGDHDHVSQGLFRLDQFYTASGNFMAFSELITGFLSLAFLIGLIGFCRQKSIGILPVLPLAFIVLALLGPPLFPAPHPLSMPVSQLAIPGLLGPLLAVLLWRRPELVVIRWGSLVSLLLMTLPLIPLMVRPWTPIAHRYIGLIILLLYGGWSLWFLLLSRLRGLPG